MKYLPFIIVLLFPPTLSHAQLLYAQINDPDGYTNVRSGPGASYPIVGQIKAGIVFGFNEIENSSWWNVNTRRDVYGLMHKSRIDPLIPTGGPSGKKIPASYYLNNPYLPAAVIAHYRGEFKVSDDNATFALLDEVDKASDQVRPFYFLALCRIVAISDGALSEVMGGYVLGYLEKYPGEAMRLLATDEYHRYREKFVSHAAFSEMFEYEDVSLQKRMLVNCDNCAEKALIIQFAKEVSVLAESYKD